MATEPITAEERDIADALEGHPLRFYVETLVTITEQMELNGLNGERLGRAGHVGSAMAVVKKCADAGYRQAIADLRDRDELLRFSLAHHDNVYVDFGVVEIAADFLESKIDQPGRESE